MLKKENRLKGTKEIDLVFKKGRSSFSKIIGIKFSKNTQEINRFAIIVGKKVSKRAVDRNAIKRKIKAIILKEKINFKTGYDFIFIVFPEILKTEDKEIKTQIVKIFQKANLYV